MEKTVEWQLNAFYGTSLVLYNHYCKRLFKIPLFFSSLYTLSIFCNQQKNDSTFMARLAKVRRVAAAL